MIFVVYLIYLWKLNFFLFCKYLELFVCVSGLLISMLEFILERVRGCMVVIDGIFEFLVLVVWYGCRVGYCFFNVKVISR